MATTTNEFQLSFKATEIDGILKKANAIPLESGDGEKAVVISEGTATGKYAIAGGTNDFDVIKNITNNEIEEADLVPAYAEGAMSIAYGPNTKALTTGSVALGTASIAGCKGFYWHKVDFINKTVTLSTVQKPYYKDSNNNEYNTQPTWNSQVDGQLLFKWQVGDIINIAEITIHQILKATITEIDATNGIITLDNIPFTNTYKDADIINNYFIDNGTTKLDFQDCSVSNPSRPEAGVIECSAGSYVNGLNCKSTGLYSHAIGRDNIAAANSSYAEGRSNTAGYCAHAEGKDNKALGSYSHTEGNYNSATGGAAHAEGMNAIADGTASHAEGNKATAFGNYSHAEGLNTTARGKSSHVEGSGTTSDGDSAHAEGMTTTAGGDGAHSEGHTTTAAGNYSHAEGLTSAALGNYSHAEGQQTTASNAAAHAEGGNTIAGGVRSHAEGSNTKATGTVSHTEGESTVADNTAAHAEGRFTTASGEAAHAEGGSTTASGYYSHAEGSSTTASGDYSHAEGSGTKAKAKYAHAEGLNTEANYNAHAEGQETKADAMASHAEGIGTVAYQNGQHVEGRYNDYQSDVYKKYLHVLGNGTSDAERSNAHTIDTDGNAWFAGNVTVGADNKKLVTLDEVKALIAEEIGKLNS